MSKIEATPTAMAVREMDELEGSLLPVATEVVECGPGNTVIPTTTQVFEYDAAEQEQWGEGELREAIVVPGNGNQLNYAGVSDDSKTTVGKAGQTGKIRSEEELETIRKNRQRIYAQNYHEENAFKAANARAKERDREGLQVKDDRLRSDFTEEKLPETLRKKLQLDGTSDGKSNKDQATKLGYQVSEYDCGNYETGDYEVTEYKSVYD